MENDDGCQRSQRSKPNSNRLQHARSKLYDPRKGSAYTKLSKTHETKLRQLRENERAVSLSTVLRPLQSSRSCQSLCNDGSTSYVETSDSGSQDSASDSPTAFCPNDQRNPKSTARQSLYINSTAARRSGNVEEAAPTISLPLNLDDDKSVSRSSVSRAALPRRIRDMECKLRMPDDEPISVVKELQDTAGRSKTDSTSSKALSGSIAIESFRKSTLPSFRNTPQRPHSFSMLTFNVGLLEVRMFGIQMYQNPGYTEKRLKCVPNEIRKANADVVAFQEVYSNHHARYITQQLQDIYPYAARDDCLPVSEDFENLYDKNKKKKRGIGMFHSGLLFLSKFPILCAKFHAWDVVTHLEAMLANKGYMEIFVDIPSVGKIAFYNMHMASASVNPESVHIENVRNEEVKQILKRTEKACRLGFAPIIIGDLNAAPNNCASNYMSFLHSGWTDSYVLSRQKAKQKRWLGLKDRRIKKNDSTFESPLTSDESIGVENVFGDNKSQKPHLEKVTIMSNMPRSRSGGNMRHPHMGPREGSRWSRFVEYLSLPKGDRLRRAATSWKHSKTYRPRANSIRLRRIHTANRHRAPKSKKLAKLHKRLLKNKLSVRVKAPCLECKTDKAARTFRERCSALFRRSKSLWTGEPKPTTQTVAFTTARSRVAIDPSSVYFLVKNPSKQLKRPRVRRFYWWYRRRNFMDVTWDPKNPLNMHGPHAGCSGLRCDYIFLPPQHIAGILQGFAPSAGEILFREPIVMIDKVGSAYNCLCSAFTSMKKVMLVTLSDHYGLKITMVRKKTKPETSPPIMLRPSQTI
ncbi:endonuclease/exonuclease/phosphatase, putative [Babesia bigemina]|uniref:Endonuclease/exonuclease/phosphatase, putative n=1 Tax=Babesia bigemina TaxID=5866 RepID=A0A061D6U6_BABBI|nr:endonuclease/exonuclease/phosphatase, putative [Babesia bigemina]CDR95727.1 endonuclease/exonuclease/phosphatase, putative [Babesia bigemina]|eukprot:XP_012767913.1 endonuclease/exonuclease/phosphatase, putative [Babesia bigemina]